MYWKSKETQREGAMIEERGPNDGANNDRLIYFVTTRVAIIMTIKYCRWHLTQRDRGLRSSTSKLTCRRHQGSRFNVLDQRSSTEIDRFSLLFHCGKHFLIFFK